MPQYAAGINNAATILTDLSAKIDINRLIELTKINPELFMILLPFAKPAKLKKIVGFFLASTWMLSYTPKIT
jgi:hypothetical protein